MKTNTEWLMEIEALYEGQKAGRIKPAEAVEMNNTIGKLIGLTKLQLEYNKLRMSGHAAKIRTLEDRTESGKQSKTPNAKTPYASR